MAAFSETNRHSLSTSSTYNIQPLPSNPNPPSIPLSNLDISATISSINDLIDLAHNTIKSVSDFFHGQGQNQLSSLGSKLSTCPFNSSHKLPPESLFVHSLRCPSSPGNKSAVINDIPQLLNSLHYPNSLKSNSKENHFTQPLQESSADLIFSLDEFENSKSNFFYKDCPGVFSSDSQVENADRTFTLPGFLSVECANFVVSSEANGGTKDFPQWNLRILPSELWVLKNEVQGWRDYPFLYSFAVLRIISGLGLVKELNTVKKWIISNSPRYGIVIDVSITDHVFVLLKLCLKAISREAVRSLEFVLSRETIENDECLKMNLMSFRCPRLVEVLTWLASQISVLYGEINGKLFVIDMFKECLINAGSSLLLFPLKESLNSSDVVGNVEGFEFCDSEAGGNGELKEYSEDRSDKGESSGKTASTGQVFVSQVAAAIAALHERSLLEKRIKDLRFGTPISKYQLISEHSHVSMRANEERSKRPEYRAILEHDGLLWQQSRNQELNKYKTREELLAEERDYKRRRMSYRGKKVKRSTTQVLRDIIEEHMEEIKQAGGIGCFVKGGAERGPGPYNSFEARKTEYGITCKTLQDDASKDQLNTRYGVENALQLQGYEDHEDHRRNTSKETRKRGHRSRSPHSYRDHHQPSEQHGHRRARDAVEVAGDKYYRSGSSSSHKSGYRDNWSFSTSSSTTHDLSMNKYEQERESKDRYRGTIYGDRISESVTQFEDRYDPSTCDRYEPTYDDVSSDSKYFRPYEAYSPPEDVQHHKELKRVKEHRKRHHHEHLKKS